MFPRTLGDYVNNHNYSYASGLSHLQSNSIHCLYLNVIHVRVHKQARCQNLNVH